jgi:hypothetical protein
MIEDARRLRADDPFEPDDRRVAARALRRKHGTGVLTD